MSIRQWQKLKQAFFKNKEEKQRCRKFSEELSTLKDQRSAYAKLKMEVFSGGVSLPNAKVLREQVGKLKMKVTELVDEYLCVVKGKDENGKEVSINFSKERNDSEAFYRSRNLPTLANALPRNMTLSSEVRAQIREAMKQGMNRVLVCADIETQEGIPLTKYKEELADKPVAYLSADDPNQYTESYMEYGVEQATVTPKEKAIRKGAYLLFYSSKPVPQESKNRTYEDAEKWLADNKQNGLTLQELYAVQLKDFLASGKHDLIAYNSIAEQSNWTWCIASRAPGGCVSARWFSAGRRVYVLWDNSDSFYGRFGVCPAIVVPIKL